MTNAALGACKKILCDRASTALSPPIARVERSQNSALQSRELSGVETRYTSILTRCATFLKCQ
jgi:hypothetical protein